MYHVFPSDFSRFFFNSQSLYCIVERYSFIFSAYFFKFLHTPSYFLHFSTYSVILPTFPRIFHIFLHIPSYFPHMSLDFPKSHQGNPLDFSKLFQVPISRGRGLRIDMKHVKIMYKYVGPGLGLGTSIDNLDEQSSSALQSHPLFLITWAT